MGSRGKEEDAVTREVPAEPLRRVPAGTDTRPWSEVLRGVGSDGDAFCGPGCSVARAFPRSARRQPPGPPRPPRTPPASGPALAGARLFSGLRPEFLHPAPQVALQEVPLGADVPLQMRRVAFLPRLMLLEGEEVHELQLQGEVVGRGGSFRWRPSTSGSLTGASRSRASTSRPASAPVPAARRWGKGATGKGGQNRKGRPSGRPFAVPGRPAGS